MSRLTIVHLTTYLQGGAGRAITDLARAQHAAGHQVLVVSSLTGAPGYDNYPHYIQQLTAARVPLLLEDSLFKRDTESNRRVVARLHATLADESADVVHAHAGTPARIGLSYAGDSGAAVIQTQHGWGTNKTEEQSRDDLEVLRLVDRVVVTSEATLTLLIESGVPSRQVRTIPCGIAAATPLVLPDAESMLAPLRAAGYHIVGCVGSINANKNQSMLLEALMRLSGRKVACVFVGEGGEDLRRHAERMRIADRVLVLGYQPDAERWMPAFDLLAVPSFTEGQGLVVLEAFRAGIPVLASDIASLRQLVIPGQTGWVFDPHDPATLVRAIEEGLDTLPGDRARIIGRARRWFEESYTTDRMLARHDRLYAQVCETRGRSTRDVTVSESAKAQSSKSTT